MLRAPRKSKSKSPYARTSGQAAAAISTAVRTTPRTQAAITRTRPQGTTATSTVSATATLPQVSTLTTGIPVSSMMEQALQTQPSQQDVVNEQGTGSTTDPDSSGAYGCGVVFGNHWSCLSWPTYWSSDIIRDITLLELVPIVLGISIWSSKLKNLKLLLHVDNMALVQIINQKTSKTKESWCCYVS
ncbi:uncharacterized protein LOC134239607 isoform X2 [Saccostrea cucullata]|uniref:uncharacterized protein LOC134239607 isoform X2 n=1 Tax=Saccostrea cuccullata TaxID=36930 RepID=UPI002ED64EFC